MHWSGNLTEALSLPVVAAAAEGAVRCERDVVERAIAGDGHAFRELVAPHLAMLYRLAARVSGEESLAEDAVQEALTIAFRKLHRYEPGTSFRAFLAAIAVRQAQTILRAELRRRAREQRAIEVEGTFTPAELLNAKRLAAQVREVLASLPEKRQRIALLRLDADLSYAEIAEITGSTEGSARVLVHLVLKELKSKLSSIVPGAGPGDRS